LQPNKKEKKKGKKEENKCHKKENGKTQHTPRQTRIIIIYMISIYISKNNVAHNRNSQQVVVVLWQEVL
jgi:hypothetical protein